MHHSTKIKRKATLNKAMRTQRTLSHRQPRSEQKQVADGTGLEARWLISGSGARHLFRLSTYCATAFWSVKWRTKHIRVSGHFQVLVRNKSIQYKSMIQHPQEWLKWGSLTIPSADGEGEKLGTLDTAGGNVKWWSHFGKQFSSFLKSQTYTYYMAQPWQS